MTWAWRTFLRHDPPWESCCEDHDLKYWLGGSADDRFAADLALAKCVADGGHRHWATLMFVGVRVFGHPLIPMPWRWGYGWRDVSSYSTQVVRRREVGGPASRPRSKSR